MDSMKWHIRTAFGLIVLIFAAMSSFFLHQSFHLGELISTIHQHPLVVSNAALGASRGVIKMHRSMKDVVLADNNEELHDAIDAVHSEETNVLMELEVVRDNILGAAGKSLEKDARKLFAEWNPIREEVIKLVLNGKTKEASRITKGKGAAHQSEVEGKMLSLSSYARNMADKFMEEAEATKSRIIYITIALMVIGFTLSLCIAIFISRKMLRFINEIGRGERSLRESERETRKIIMESPLAMAVYSKEDVVELLNNRFVSLFGYRRDEISTLSDWLDLALPDDEQKEQARNSLLWSDKEYCGPEVAAANVAVTCKNGSTRIVEIHGSCLENKNLAIFNDITDRIKAEENALHLQERLSHTQKMEAIGALAGGIAHDFNNILSAIIGYAEMVKEDLTPGSQPLEDINEVLKAAQRAKELVNQILSFSRKNNLEKRPLLLQHSIKETTKMLRASIPKTINFTVKLDQSCGAVMADPTQIHQILVNLCTNAASAMATTHQNGELRVELRQMDIKPEELSPEDPLDPGHYVKLSVIDNGPGIPEEIRDRIFEPYFTTKGRGEGTGMGLATVHTIVNNHRGVITLETPKEGGCAFHVFLPVVASPEFEHEEQPPVPIPTGKETLMVVDDETFNVDILSRTLTKLGYQVIAKTSGRAGLETFRENPDRIDLVITDYTMPHMTGATMAKELLQIRPELPIIVCTGYSSDMSEERAREIGIRGYLMKPAERGSLARLVRKLLDER